MVQILYNVRKVEKHWINDQSTTGTQSSSKVAGYQVNLYKANKHLNVQLISSTKKCELKLIKLAKIFFSEMVLPNAGKETVDRYTLPR